MADRVPVLKYSFNISVGSAACFSADLIYSCTHSIYGVCIIETL